MPDQFNDEPKLAYHAVLNCLTDDVMPTVSGNAWKILSLVVRRTVGCQRLTAAISYTEIMEGTRIKSRASVSKAVKELTGLGLLKAESKWKSRNQRERATYGLRPEFIAQITGVKVEFVVHFLNCKAKREKSTEVASEETPPVPWKQYQSERPHTDEEWGLERRVRRGKGKSSKR